MAKQLDVQRNNAQLLETLDNADKSAAEIENLKNSLSGKANIEGGNDFSGVQRVVADTQISAQFDENGLAIARPQSSTSYRFDGFEHVNPQGSVSVKEENGNLHLNASNGIFVNGLPLSAGVPSWQTTDSDIGKIHKGRNVLFATPQIGLMQNPVGVLIKTNIRVDGLQSAGGNPVQSQVDFRLTLSGHSAPSPNQLAFEMDIKISAKLQRNMSSGVLLGSVSAINMTGKMPSGEGNPMSGISVGYDGNDGMLCFIISHMGIYNTSGFIATVTDALLKRCEIRTTEPDSQWKAQWINDFSPWNINISDWISPVAVTPSTITVMNNNISIPLINGYLGNLTAVKLNGICYISSSIISPDVPASDVIAIMPQSYRPAVGTAPGHALAVSHQADKLFSMSSFLNTSGELRWLQPSSEPLLAFPASITGCYPSQV
jgi:hypothetical protein